MLYSDERFEGFALLSHCFVRSFVRSSSSSILLFGRLTDKIVSTLLLDHLIADAVRIPFLSPLPVVGQVHKFLGANTLEPAKEKPLRQCSRVDLHPFLIQFRSVATWSRALRIEGETLSYGLLCILGHGFDCGVKVSSVKSRPATLRPLSGPRQTCLPFSATTSSVNCSTFSSCIVSDEKVARPANEFSIL